MVERLDVDTVEATETAVVVSVFGIGVGVGEDAKGKLGIHGIAGDRECAQRSVGSKSPGGKTGLERMVGSAIIDV